MALFHPLPGDLAQSFVSICDGIVVPHWPLTLGHWWRTRGRLGEELKNCTNPVLNLEEYLPFVKEIEDIPDHAEDQERLEHRAV